MPSQLDIRYGTVCEIKAFSEKPDSPRRKFCVIKVEFPELGIVKQSVGQFAHHKGDMLGKTVLCLINLGSKNMFGQASEILVMGVPHPAGGVIPGDAQEHQATYLYSHLPVQAASQGPVKPLAAFDHWLKQDFRLALVTKQTETALQVRSDQQSWQVALSAPIATALEGKMLMLVSPPEGSDAAQLLYAASGEPILAHACDERVVAGLQVY